LFFTGARLRSYEYSASYGFQVQDGVFKSNGIPDEKVWPQLFCTRTLKTWVFIVTSLSCFNKVHRIHVQHVVTGKTCRGTGAAAARPSTELEDGGDVACALVQPAAERVPSLL